MMKVTPSRIGLRTLAVLLLPACLITLALVGRDSNATGSRDARRLVLMPHIPNEVRVLGSVEGHLVVYDPLEAKGRVRLRELRIRSEGILIHRMPLNVELAGDPLFGEIQSTLERLPHEVGHLHRERDYFAPPGASELEGRAISEAHERIARQSEVLRTRRAAGGPHSFVELAFPLPIDQLFFIDDPAGTYRELELELEFVDPGGELRIERVTEKVLRLASPLAAPHSVQETVGGVSIHAGDLHVHSCHGEAANACAPSSDCAAESFQTSGSFSYAALKSQFQALGLDWFTATDHSYCINSTAEYQTIVAETAALTDTNFIVIPDLELSSDEVGPQTGSDATNLLCLFGSPQNHMGAHGISSRIPGGSDGFLGFCDPIGGDALDNFLVNVAAVRGQGGYPIVHHPTAGSFAWNSFEATQGIESGALHGVEIWNGDFVSGQGGDVGRWVDWLLGGRVLYAYSGSDTHDEAFAFGANHAVLIDEVFTPDNLQNALRAGRSYVSNGPVAMMEVEVGGQTAFMGARYPLPDGAPAVTITPRVQYNVGSDPSVITIFRGRVSNPAEIVLCQSATLTGSGSFECTDNLTAGVRSWYRAYVESLDGTRIAYTNPVFFEPGGADNRVYCQAKVNSLGCLPTTAFSGTPSASSPAAFDLFANNVRASQNGILFYGFAPDLAPFQDGTRCVAAPIKRTPVQNSGGTPGTCDGAYTLNFNARIQSGIDPGLVAGASVFAQYWTRDPQAASSTGLTDAVQFTIGP